MLAVIGSSVRGGWAAGFATGLGIATGNVVWSIAAIAGSEVIFHRFPQAVVGVQLLGCAYLSYLGLRSLKAAMSSVAKRAVPSATKDRGAYYVTGLIVIFTNPKAILFFASVFTALIPANAGVSWKVIAVLLVGLIPALGHTFTTSILSRPRMIKKYFAFQRHISAVFAAAFLLIALKLMTDILKF